MVDFSSQPQKCHEYIHALKEEKKKMLMFQRELPLSLQLVTQTIENVRQKMLANGDDEAMTTTSLAEFLSLRPSSSWSEDDDISGRGDTGRPGVEKPDWLKSVQLWNQESRSGNDGVSADMEGPWKPVAVNVTKNCGAFQAFEKEKNGAADSSSTSTEMKDSVESDENRNKEQKEEQKEKEGQCSQSQLLQGANRKARRCWSPELHRRFVQALQQLGGSHVATPKQIRELMKVDGLTNDEVKSHLQKYRLHTKRPSPPIQSNNNVSPPAPQFVVVGSIWVPPPEYAVVAAATVAHQTNPPCAPNEIYAPVASHPSIDRGFQQIKKHSQRSPTGPLASDRCSDDNNSLRDTDDYASISDSPTNSYSSQTTTYSPQQ